MAVESVFLPAATGMGPALSPKGEAVVASKMVHRDAMLDELERKGLNVRALAHRHSHDGGCRTCGSHHGEAGCAAAGCAEAAEPSAPATLEEALARLARQEGEIAHLRHKLAVQENQILLLREALSASKGEPETSPRS